MAQDLPTTFIDFPVSEYETRLARAQAAMADAGLGALLVTTEGNVRYFTGHSSHRWFQSTAPQFALVPLSGRPVLLAPGIEAGRAGQNPFLARFIAVGGYERIGIAELIRTVEELGLSGRKVGAELGLGFHLGMPVDDFRLLEREASGVAFVDATDLLWALRTPKSLAEADILRRACAITGRAFDRLLAAARPGMTEKQLCSTMVQAVMAEGADWPGSIPLGSRSPGEQRAEDAHLRLPTDRVVGKGDLVWLDAGCRLQGYWSDMMRMFCIGPAQPAWKEAYRFIWEATRASIEAAQPGRPMAETVAPVERMLRASPYAELAVKLKTSRIGHAVGLDLTEPPSMSYNERSILQPGMVLTIEPSIYLPELGFFMVEEDVLITETGNEILSPQAAPELPEVAI